MVHTTKKINDGPSKVLAHQKAVLACQRLFLAPNGPSKGCYYWWLSVLPSKSHSHCRFAIKRPIKRLFWPVKGCSWHQKQVMAHQKAVPCTKWPIKRLLLLMAICFTIKKLFPLPFCHQKTWFTIKLTSHIDFIFYFRFFLLFNVHFYFPCFWWYICKGNWKLDLAKTSRRS